MAPSSYYRHQQQSQHPQQRSRRCLKDEHLLILIRNIWQQSRQIYGARKVWRALLRDGHRVARCTVEHLMRKHQMQGVWRGKGKRTTVCDPQLQRAGDWVKRRLSAESPNQLWVADFTYVTTHQGFVYTAFVIDVFARRIVGWKVSKRMDTDMVMDALAQALYARCPKGVIHHSDRGSRYLSIRYTERLRQAQMKASVGTKGDSYDNAPTQTINGLYKAEVIHPNGLGGDG
ncbi:IS3 family transposase [Paralysiella testudinis]|uniref:IS3 family transposase n=1 Tax=Paralysiella testudinis TaxID=2809020 RepID=A0A892ZNI2_9NEIS|nr:IS3 family transposase [Paralysiella testudinis]